MVFGFQTFFEYKSTNFVFQFKPKPGEEHPPHSYYHNLFPTIVKDIEGIEDNWRCGKHNLQRINCR